MPWLGLVLLLHTPLTARGELSIVITRGVDRALPVAVVPFAWDGLETAPLDIAALLKADLMRSGYFTAPDTSDLPQQPHDKASIRFSDWRRLGIDHMVIGELRNTSVNRFEIDFRLFNITQGTQMLGLRVPASLSQLRWATHQIADLIFEKLTGVRGAFATRIAYIAVRTVAGRAIHSLNVADSDGYNSKILLESTQPLLSPSWSPDGKKLAYVSFETKNSAIYVQDIHTGKRELISSEPGINSAPAFSPDGSRLAMTLSHEGNPDIYILFLKSRILKRLTYHPAIDTEPTWLQDGRSLAFTSDRGGSPQIYTMDVNAKQPKRLSFEGSYNARPAYSQDGNHIAMVHGTGQGYHIAVMDLESGYFKILTQSSHDESPSFAPNGNMIMYATRSGSKAQLAAISVDGSIQQQLQSPNQEVREPAWGPFLQP